VKVRVVIAALRSDGWERVKSKGGHRQYKHPIKAGRVTVAGALSAEVPIGTLKSIEKQARLALK
jgi:predicted RNA binding protein YcfA (HicA-like mRNA interferase family)